jgi:hypothetical protein
MSISKRHIEPLEGGFVNEFGCKLDISVIQFAQCCDAMSARSIRFDRFDVLLTLARHPIIQIQ